MVFLPRNWFSPFLRTFPGRPNLSSSTSDLHSAGDSHFLVSTLFGLALASYVSLLSAPTIDPC